MQICISTALYFFPTECSWSYWLVGGVIHDFPETLLLRAAEKPQMIYHDMFRLIYALYQVPVAPRVFA